jgi:hypothetical protein
VTFLPSDSSTRSQSGFRSLTEIHSLNASPPAVHRPKPQGFLLTPIPPLVSPDGHQKHADESTGKQAG